MDDIVIFYGKASISLTVCQVIWDVTRNQILPRLFLMGQPRPLYLFIFKHNFTGSGAYFKIAFCFLKRLKNKWIEFLQENCWNGGEEGFRKIEKYNFKIWPETYFKQTFLSLSLSWANCKSIWLLHNHLELACLITVYH